MKDCFSRTKNFTVFKEIFFRYLLTNNGEFLFFFFLFKNLGRFWNPLLRSCKIVLFFFLIFFSRPSSANNLVFSQKLFQGHSDPKKCAFFKFYFSQGHPDQKSWNVLELLGTFFQKPPGQKIWIFKRLQEMIGHHFQGLLIKTRYFSFKKWWVLKCFFPRTSWPLVGQIARICSRTTKLLKIVVFLRFIHRLQTNI